MAGQHKSPCIASLRKLEAALQADMQTHVDNDVDPQAPRRRFRLAWPQLNLFHFSLGRATGWFTAIQWPSLGPWWPLMRRCGYVVGALVGVVFLGMAALWWRLGHGPIAFDVATPWLTSAIEENFGSRHRVEVGGTQLERGADGRTALRIRDIVVRAPDGSVVASAPKAEVSVSSADILSGRFRAESLRLVGAEVAVRIETDGRLTVFAGAENRPIATASAIAEPITTRSIATTAAMAAVSPEPVPAAPAATSSGIPDFAALLAWIDGIGATGLDGHDLSELGLKGGNLVVDDRRSGKRWTLEKINLSLTRPSGGGIAFELSSESAERPWMLRAALAPSGHGNRAITVDAQKVPIRELLLALRIGNGEWEPDIPVSARIRAEIGRDGIPQSLTGRILADKGFIVDADDPDTRIAIDRVEMSVDWDAARNALMMPFQLLSGSNRITLLGQISAPPEQGGSWGVRLTGGSVVLAGAGPNDDAPLILNRFRLRLRVDPKSKRIDIEQGDIGNMEVGVAISGGLDYSSGEPRLVLGIAGNRMSVSTMKRLWPAVITPKVRAWVEEHIHGGTVERLVIATNSPLANLKSSGPPITSDGLSIEIIGKNASLHPVPGLPMIRDADMNVHITGRTAVINLGRGNIELPSGRRLTIASGVFEVPDTYPKEPPARARFRLDGPVPAASELLTMDRLRGISGTPIDPATSRGTLTAQVVLGFPLKNDLPPGSTNYAINVEVTNFSADRMVMGHRVEAASLRAVANPQSYQIKGDVKINGIPATLEYRKTYGESEAEVRILTNLDEAARDRLGYDLSGSISGPVPVKLNGRIAADERQSKFAVEADLTQAKVDNLLPGMSKPAGKPARATFTWLSMPHVTRFDDLTIEGAGMSVKGSIEVDALGDLQLAHFPNFSPSDGDKATLKAERGTDGVLKVTMRGDVYDGREFVKATMAGTASSGSQKPQPKDVDLDIKIGTVAGFHGETLRGLDLKMSRRGGNIRGFALSAKLGVDTPVIGDLRGRGSGRQVIYVETNDAGAFFRFTDIYPKMFGGEMWVAMDPPTAEQTPQEGILNIRGFTVRGEAALDRVIAGAAGAPTTGVEFSRMRVDFTRGPGRLAVRDGVVRGPAIGATIDGHIDYRRDEVRLRGTFVPLYGLNNMFGQIPIVGIFLGGGSNEGLVGITYEVVGTPGSPLLRVNPISAVAPGLLRKFFEFPNGTNPTPPQSIQ